MTQSPAAVIIYSTVPDLLLAKRIAHVLVEDHLAACVNLSAQGLSLYLWQESLEGSEEITLTIKTSSLAQQACMDKLLAMHPYEVPEIIVVPIIGGHPDYLQWIAEQTNSATHGL